MHPIAIVVALLAIAPAGIPSDVWEDCLKQADVSIDLVRQNVFNGTKELDKLAPKPIMDCAKADLVAQCVVWRQAAEKIKQGRLRPAWCAADAAVFLKNHVKNACDKLDAVDRAIAKQVVEAATDQILEAASEDGLVH